MRKGGLSFTRVEQLLQFCEVRFIGRFAAQGQLTNGVGRVDASIAGRRDSSFALDLNAQFAKSRIAGAARGECDLVKDVAGSRLRVDVVDRVALVHVDLPVFTGPRFVAKDLLDRALAARFCTAGLLEIVRIWVEEGMPEPPERLARRLRLLVEHSSELTQKLAEL